MVRDKKYLQSAKGRICCCCMSNVGVVMHHLRTGTDCGMGLKSNDCHTIPLDYRCHAELHNHGEKKFLKKHDYIFNGDPVGYAERLYKEWIEEIS